MMTISDAFYYLACEINREIMCYPYDVGTFTAIIFAAMSHL